MPGRNKTYLFLAPLFLLLVWFIVRSVSQPCSDYASYYFGSRLLLGGNYKAAYDTWSLNALLTAEGYKNIFASYTPFPPFTAVLLYPFVLIPLVWSKLIFNVLSCGFFLFTLLRSTRFFSIPSWLLLLVPVVFLIPVMNNIYFGQAYLILFSLLLEGYMAYKKGRIVLSAFLWAIAVLFKIFPVLILVFLVLRKKYRAALYCIIAIGLLAIPSLLLPNGFASWKWYVFELLPRLGNGELNDPFTYMFESAFMLLKNLFVYDALLNPGAPFNNPPLFMAAVALFKALILSAAVMITLREKENDFIPFAVWITASMLLSPNGSSYSLVLLLIPFLQLGANAQIRLSKKHLLPAALVVLFLLVVLPVYRLSSWPLLLRFPRLYLFVVFFGLLLLQSTRVFNYKLLLLLFAVFFLPGLIKPAPTKDSSVYLLSKEEHLLIVGYGVEQNRLVYSWFDGTGLHETQTAYAVKEATAGDLYIRDNQLWYHGRKITATADHKMSPLLIDGQDIVYLSDKNRGVGFYTLRRLTLAQALQDAAAWPVSAQ